MEITESHPSLYCSTCGKFSGMSGTCMCHTLIFSRTQICNICSCRYNPDIRIRTLGLNNMCHICFVSLCEWLSTEVDTITDKINDFTKKHNWRYGQNKFVGFVTNYNDKTFYYKPDLKSQNIDTTCITVDNFVKDIVVLLQSLDIDLTKKIQIKINCRKKSAKSNISK